MLKREVEVELTTVEGVRGMAHDEDNSVMVSLFQRNES
jgi:hypothetical protein